MILLMFREVWLCFDYSESLVFRIRRTLLIFNKFLREETSFIFKRTFPSGGMALLK
jgi:hypothetical protein